MASSYQTKHGILYINKAFNLQINE